MTSDLIVDLCVIGAGSGGLSVAAGASQMGASVVLVEKGAMGGDCLNTGCVPSKSLLAAGHAALVARDAARLGVFADVSIDARAVRRHVRDVIAAIAPTDSVERFEGLGVTVIRAAARFTGRDAVEAGGRTIRARRFVIATGAKAAVPPIPGLAGTPHHTNETIFGLEEIPEHLIIIGGGPVGMEMADAHAALGARVTVLEAARILSRDDEELAGVVGRALRARGVDIQEGVSIRSVETVPGGIAVDISHARGRGRVTGSHLLVAAGRVPRVEGLGLEKAGVAVSAGGIVVDARLRTSNKKIFAIGDVAAGAPQFTHVAGYHASVVLKNALFRIPAKVDYAAVPRITYTDPELAQVGTTEAEARARGMEIRILRETFAENDRARAERRTEGLIKVIACPRGRVLGAGIVGKGAGDLIQPWILAVSGKMKLAAMASLVAPYPTRGEISKRVAGAYYLPKLFSATTRKIVRFLARFG